MSEQYKPVKGDRVKVTIEGEVSYVSLVGYDVKNGDSSITTVYKGGSGVTVEKLEPPVEVFKPGDVVRSKADPGYVYLVQPDEGYAYISIPDSPGLLLGKSFKGVQFTSKNYEKVNLG